ncbi:MAG: hypothetical protein K8L91_07655 [Anaerolineae bacterium]|nr:hypothetical protein [Anaerolineae bacterium]
MYSLDPLMSRQEYEDRLEWLKRLYGRPADSTRPSRIRRWLNRLLFILGSGLVAIGHRMQVRHDVPASPSSLAQQAK